MDLTALFESKEALLKKVADEATAGSVAQCRGPETSDLEPKVDAECLVRANPHLRDPDSDFLEVAKKTREQKEKVLFKQTEPAASELLGAQPGMTSTLGKRKLSCSGSRTRRPRPLCLDLEKTKNLLRSRAEQLTGKAGWREDGPPGAASGSVSACLGRRAPWPWQQIPNPHQPPLSPRQLPPSRRKWV